ncbi:iron-containing redox enzyme family protein [Blastococcus jejuensis]|uniref:Iron-containing redox enzyme family protein n=1 Tax=Blastococcus jejuensis TaxID=351224 RepID=A0ABP6PNB4_9ACTN
MFSAADAEEGRDQTADDLMPRTPGVVVRASDITWRGASNPPGVGMLGSMHLPEPRGPLSAALFSDLVGRPTLSSTTTATAEQVAAQVAGAMTDDDLQISLAVCYELHYRGFDDVPDHWEWEPALLGLRGVLERRHLAALRELVGPLPVTDEPIDRQLAALIAADDGPSLSAYMAKQGTLEQWREYLTVRSVYHLKEGDPHTFAVPRLSGRAKAAMVEIQADEYGGGTPERMHSELFAGLMRDLDLDAGYGALWDDAPAAAFASVNTMSLFALHRRWRGAAVGHLTAVEMTSSEPSRRYSAGLRRLGFDERTTVFYDEHVEADAVHEQIAAVDMCGSLVAEQPELAADVLFGAAAALAMDGVTAHHLLGAWEAGRSGLRGERPLAA